VGAVHDKGRKLPVQDLIFFILAMCHEPHFDSRQARKKKEKKIKREKIPIEVATVLLISLSQIFTCVGKGLRAGSKKTILLRTDGHFLSIFSVSTQEACRTLSVVLSARAQTPSQKDGTAFK
jgi:hypothetical protein